MSSSDRRAALLLVAGLALGPALAACGFTPVHAPGGPGGALAGTVLTDPPESRLDYVVTARLEDRLGRATAPRWALGYTIRTRETGGAVSAEGVETRYTVTGELDWSLRPAGGGEPVRSGTLESFTSYSTTGTAVATLTARRDAEDRLMTILADRLVAMLYAEAGALVP